VVAFVVCLAAALAVDPVRSIFSLKGDEATYSAMALSLAYDGDLTYERGDLERFWAVYLCGPDGIYLKRGKKLTDPERGKGFRVRWQGAFPFIKVMKWGDSDGTKLYFGKAYVHALFAAPFVRLFGLNGILVFHVVLLALVGLCGYAFLRARAPARAALAFTTAFFGATLVPLYTIWMTPEVFNLSFVFFAYFLWLYKEVAPEGAGSRWTRFLRGGGSDFAAAVLLGIVTFSKPLNILLIGPVVLFLWWRRRWVRGFLVGVVFVATVVSLFSVNLAITGEFSYQGGYRKLFYGWFPFETPEATFETARGGYMATTNDADTENVLEEGHYLQRLGLNTYYFFVGRYAGFIPYFFPGAVALVLWLWRRRDMQTWQVLTLLGLVASTLVILVMMPYTWNGGGGPPGNRYFLNLYPVLFFLVPPLTSVRPAIVAWIGGAFFTAQALVSPGFTSKYPYWTFDHGPVRMLPIELTMVNDLPITLDRNRARQPYGKDPELSLFLIDENVYPPEPAGIWSVGGRRGDLVFRTKQPLASLRVSLRSPIPNKVWLKFDGQSVSVDLKPEQPMDVVMSTRGGVFAERGFSHVLSVKAENGFVPMLTEPGSRDKRFLGVLMRLQGTVR
jgi:hypothetical protein